MKKNFVYAMMSAIALSGAVSFSACSSSDEITDVNPTYDGKVVKTQFAIAIPTAGSGYTRMESGAAQENEVFSGMKGIKLYPFTTASLVDGTSSQITQAPIELGNLGVNDLDKTGSPSGTFHAKVYNDVEIPVGTQTFLFYGQKTDGQGGELKANYGTSGTPSANISFELVGITDKTFATVSSTGSKAEAVLAALNGVASVLSAQQDAANTASHSIAPTLLNLYNSLKTNHAGSANSVCLLMEDLYNSLSGKTDTYSQAVVTEIETYFDPSGTDGFSWKTSNTFPQDLYLPDGAASVNWDDTNSEFVFGAANISSLGGNELTNYVKPAALFYTVNTPLRADSKAHADQYDSQTSWTNVVSLYGSSSNAVVQSSRAVVLEKPINYAVAQLVTTVAISSTATTLKANDGTDATTGSSDPVLVDVTKPSGGYSFTVTGILVGGQKNVLWDFTTNTSATEKVVYDPVMTSSTMTATATGPSAANYTLLLETIADQTQRIAVEFINDGEDFFGINDQLIPHGSKFYLLAELNPETATDKHSRTKVFEQDYKTVVRLTISENSLTKAYNVIPDLRTPKMELGLSVDLHWETGMEFDVTF